MSASYMESSFYNVFYKNQIINSPNTKKIRFATQNLIIDSNLTGGDQDDSNFGLDPPAIDGQSSIKTSLKKL